MMDFDTGMNAYHIETFQETPLTLACEQLNYDVAVQLINENADVNQGNNNGETPLIQTARNAYKDEGAALKIVDLLLDAGADINAQTKTTRETALMRATWYGSYQVVKLLLSRGADASLRAQDGNAVLSSIKAMPSLAKRRKRIIKLLEQADEAASNHADPGGNDFPAPQTSIAIVSLLPDAISSSASLSAGSIEKTEALFLSAGTSNGNRNETGSRKAESQIGDDRQAILGHWKMVACVQDEQQLRFCDIGRLFEFTPTHFGCVRPSLYSEYDLYPDQTPKAIDTFVSRADNMVVKGIYELNGDELRLLFHSTHSGDEQARPTSMTGLANHPYRAVRVYRRYRPRPSRPRTPRRHESGT